MAALEAQASLVFAELLEGASTCLPCVLCMCRDASRLDVLLDYALETHRATRLGFEPQQGAGAQQQEEAASSAAFAAACAAPAAGRPALDAFGCAPPALPVDELPCPNCARTVAACRFAPHLEKCLGKGRNATRVAKRGACTFAHALTRLCASSLSPRSRPEPLTPVTPLSAGPAELYVPSWAPKRVRKVGKGASGGALAAPVAPARAHTPVPAAPPPPLAAALAPPAPPPVRVPAAYFAHAAFAPPPRKPAGPPSDGARRKELRALFASRITLPDLQRYAACPPSAAQAVESLTAEQAVIRTTADGFRQLEHGGSAAAGLADDVAVTLSHICCVVSQRSVSLGRLCSNGLACSNHGREQRQAMRHAVYGDELPALLALPLPPPSPPAVSLPALYSIAPLTRPAALGEGHMMMAPEGRGGLHDDVVMFAG